MGNEEIIKFLKDGKVGVIPTDTIYGIVGSALKEETVQKIYHLRKRNPEKPFIILISSIEGLKLFGVFLTVKQKEFLEKNWPNPLSIILPCLDEKFSYLHRGKKSLAFRMPNDKKLLNILKHTGPLVAPSANFEGEKPAENIEEAKKYFSDKVDFYIDEGEIIGNSSTLVEFDGDLFKILRQGGFKIY